MAKQGKRLPARKQRNADALLLRSAESLGRIIGSLQRELDGAIARFDAAEGAQRAAARNGDGDRGTGARGTGPAQTAGNGAAPVKARRDSVAKKARSTADRESTRASKSAGAKETAGRQSGARKAARRTTRGS